jgi:hypothetical protein
MHRVHDTCTQTSHKITRAQADGYNLDIAEKAPHIPLNSHLNSTLISLIKYFIYFTHEIFHYFHVSKISLFHTSKDIKGFTLKLNVSLITLVKYFTYFTQEIFHLFHISNISLFHTRRHIERFTLKRGSTRSWAGVGDPEQSRDAVSDHFEVVEGISAPAVRLRAGLRCDAAHARDHLLQVTRARGLVSYTN